MWLITIFRENKKKIFTSISHMLGKYPYKLNFSLPLIWIQCSFLRPREDAVHIIQVLYISKPRMGTGNSRMKTYR